jgi:hypothetical protein
LLKKNGILLASIAFLAVAILAITAWKFYELSPSQIFPFGTSNPDVADNKGTLPTTVPASVSAANTKTVADALNTSAQPVSVSATFPDARKVLTGALGDNLRKLLHSNELSKIDYGVSRIRPWCMVSAKQAGERETVIARMANSIKKDKQRILAGAPSWIDSSGGASLEKRVAAMDRFHEFCKISTEGNAVMWEEFERIKLKPEFARRQAIASMFLPADIDLTSVKIKDALETVVRSPMYATLGDILRNKLDTSSLGSTYSEDEISILRLFASDILVCRLGDDCGPDGFANLWFCQSAGICGNDLESGIWDYLKENKVDTAALRQFIDQRQQALNLLDFTILKKPK